MQGRYLDGLIHEEDAAYGTGISTMHAPQNIVGTTRLHLVKEGV